MSARAAGRRDPGLAVSTYACWRRVVKPSGLRGEHAVVLSSLPPADAIGLFCTRASAARSDLVVDDESLAAAGEICDAT